MKKYLQIIKITFCEYFVYRLNFFLWRFRNLVFFLTLCFFWLAIYGGKDNLLGYQKSQMLTYVVGIAFLRAFVLASRSVDLTGQIRTGELTKVILAPINIFNFWFARDLPDKFLNILFSVIEICIVSKILNLPFYRPHSLNFLVAFLIMIFLSTLLYFFLSMVLAITAFWTEEIWATRWLFGVIFLEFFAGAFFPLDILPTGIQKIIYLTPFPYLVFFPLKIYLEQISGKMIIKSILICSIWLIIFWILMRFLWQRGSKNYGAYGG